MKASELRIGNLAYIDGEVKEIRSGFIHNLSDGYVSHPVPIPLTEEWRLNIGFRKTNDKLWFLPMPKIKAELHFEVHNYGNVITIQSDFGMLIPEDVEFVHQVQNLVFALTGEELTINK